MSPISPQVIRSRNIRAVILRLLASVFEACPDVATTIQQVYAGFSSGKMPIDRGEIDSELIVMLQDDWILETTVKTFGPMPEKAFLLTRRGRDFLLAEMPWMKVDEYSGDQRFTG